MRTTNPLGDFSGNDMVDALFGTLNKPPTPSKLCKACNGALKVVGKMGVCTKVGCREHMHWVKL